MAALKIIICIILALNSIVLVGSVLLQSNRESGLGSIGGGETMFGNKSRAMGIEGRLARVTAISGATLMVLSAVMCLLVQAG